MLNAAENLAEAGKVNVKIVNYNGWRNSFILNNGVAEVIVVPSIGRIMQFRLVGEEGVIWENQAMIGRKVNPKLQDWSNFGGDKSWPAPQSDWPKITPRAWPPPVAFDSLPLDAAEKEGILELTSPVDPHYGIRVIRRIQLSPDNPVMTITTRFEKIAGKPVKTSIWIITQCKDPVGVYVPLPAKSIFAEGYSRQSEGLPSNLKVSNRMFSLTRGSETNEKIGSDSGTLVWVGARQVLRINSPRIPNQEYPDKGSSAEVYTNADPLKYVELELLGPLKWLKPGDHMEQTSTYTLRRRGSKDPLSDARKILGLDR
jgi:hypothetical protein